MIPRRYTVGSLILLMFLTSFVGASGYYLAKSVRSAADATAPTDDKSLDEESLKRRRERKSFDSAVFIVVTLVIPTAVVLILSTALGIVRLANRDGKGRRRAAVRQRDPLIE